MMYIWLPYMIPDEDVKSTFNRIYSLPEDKDLYPTFYLGFFGVITDNISGIPIPPDPHLIVAFSNGCVQGRIYKNSRNKLERYYNRDKKSSTNKKIVEPTADF